MAEIHLNRTGINSVETPSAPVEVETGSVLRLKMINHGAPIHLTLAASNAQPFTDFYHQNVYVREEATYDIPIREDAFPGAFDLTVITGYGTVRAALKVHVLREPPRREEPSRPRYPALPSPRQTPPPAVLLFAAAGVVLYLVWWMTRLDVVNFAAFLLLLAGIVIGWLIQRS